MKSVFKSILIATTITSCIYNTLTAQQVDPPAKEDLIKRASARLLVDEGIRVINNNKYREANIKFRQATIKDPSYAKAFYWTGSSYYYMNLFGYAIQYGKQALTLDSKTDADIYFIIGRSFHELNNIDSALTYYNYAIEKLSKTRVKELQIEKRISECNLSKKYFAYEYETIKFPISSLNTENNEYAPILVDNGKKIYFTSRRNNTTGGNLNPDDEQYFEDIYQAEWSDFEKKWTNVTNKIGRLNGDGFEAFSFVKNDETFALLTLNNTAIDSGTDTRSSDICEVTKNSKGNWNSPKIIDNKTINTTFFDGAATVSSDGKMMVFASDRAENKTMTDLYVVLKVGKKWGEAKLLSTEINTVENETTPYLSQDGKYLFFSSNGHDGFGGYDIYLSKNLGNGKFSKPINLGPKINSVNNDTHFQYYPELNKAVMAAMVVTETKTTTDLFEIDLTNYIFPVE